PERGTRLGVFRRQFQRGVERGFHFAGDALRERLRDRDALAVAAEREGATIVAVGFVGPRFAGGVGVAGEATETRGALPCAGYKIRRMDARSLDRNRCAERLERKAGFVGLVEVAAVECAPGVL